MSKLLAAIIALYEILKLVSSVTKKTYVGIYNEKVKEATDKVEKTRDQKELEEITFKDSGKPTKKQYKGMYIKKKSDTKEV